MHNGGMARRLPKAYSRVVSSKLSLSDFEVPLLTRQWVRIDRCGRAKLVTVNKHDIIRELCLASRDLITVDQEVPIAYPSGLLIRERCLIVNLDSIRLITGKDQVFVTSVPHEDDFAAWEKPTASSWFVRELAQQLQIDATDKAQKQAQGGVGGGHRRPSFSRTAPFQLRVLETALHMATQELAQSVKELLASADEPLAILAAAVTSGALEEVRQIKAYLQDMMIRIGAIRQELRRLLDDDEDMADMFLDRAQDLPASPLNAELGVPSMHSGSEPSVANGAAPQHPLRDDLSMDAAVLGEVQDMKTGEDLVLGLPEASKPAGHSLTEPHGQHKRYSSHPHNIEEAEDLLETYYMRADYLHSRLSLLKERIDDCEDLINIRLDHRRNDLVGLNLFMTLATACFGLVAMVAGIFGMNLDPLPISSSQTAFWVVISSSIALALLLGIVVISLAVNRNLLFIPKLQFALRTAGQRPALDTTF